LITPQQTLAAAREAGLGRGALKLADVAVLTFSRAVVDRLEERCGLQDAEWISPMVHPYAAVRVVKVGQFQGLRVAALVPPMGASPMACVAEDLAACGVQAVFLVCAAWSLGPPVALGDLIVPDFSVGQDGTSIHYGNSQGRVRAASEIVAALEAACRTVDATVHVGGNGTCEALYRVSPGMAGDLRRRGCLCMDNGEASTVLALARQLGIVAGVLFQPYIELQRGWDPARLRDERYRIACRRQADAVLLACADLSDQGFLQPQEGES
jgi:uridine phosphorylase